MATAEKTPAKSENSEKAGAPKTSGSKSRARKAVAAAKPGMTAVIRFRGEQFTVSPGQKLTINRFDSELGKAVVFDEVLLLSSDNDGQQTVLVGNPLVAGAKVNAKVLGHDKGKKVLIFKKKRRKGYTKTQGHRQLQTELLIEEIVASR